MHGHPPGLSAATAGARCPRFTVRSRRRALPATMLAFTLLLGAAACSSDDNADPPDTTKAPNSAQSTTTPATTTTTELKSEEDEVAEAYLKAKAAYYQSGSDPSSAADALADFYEGAALQGAKAIRAEQDDAGIVTRFVNGASPSPEVMSVSIKGDAASVEICLVDNVQQVMKASDEVVDDAVVSRRQTVEMRRRSSRWVVADGKTVKSWNDDEGCDR